MNQMGGIVKEGRSSRRGQRCSPDRMEAILEIKTRNLNLICWEAVKLSIQWQCCQSNSEVLFKKRQL